MIKVAVLMTVFNRRDATFKCLGSLFGVARQCADISVNVILADAGSDDTGRDAQALWQEVRPFCVGADTYWAEGMRAAWESSQDDQFDYYMWLNNDVVLSPNWFRELFADGVMDPQRKSCIVVGGCADPVTGAHTYGGFNLVTGANPIRFEPAYVNGTYQPCDTLNGNIVVVATETDRMLGGFPPHYRHNLADLAYGLNAARSGVRVLLTPSTVGLCPRNAPHVPKGSLMERLLEVRQVKNYPLRQWSRFCLTYGGLRGLPSIFRPYIRAALGRSLDHAKR